MICPICKRKVASLVADHNHDTGAPRDMICRKCNAGLGMFKDDPAALRAAADYLERHIRNPRGALGYLADQLQRFHPRVQQRIVRAELSDYASSHTQDDAERHEAKDSPVSRT